jgi:CheY-like chemotaxis protein
MNRVLIIEDEKIKIERLRAFFENDVIAIKESYRAGVLELKTNFTEYNLLILDMTIPLWESGNNDLGGNYEQFGGEKVLREMKRRKLLVPTILFTMFDVFPTKNGNITFKEINQKYVDSFSPFYKGAVFYNSIDDSWMENMKSIIDQIKVE